MSAAGHVPDPVAGERDTNSVSRVLSVQSRISNVLAIGLMSVLGLGSLTWYYANAMLRQGRARDTAKAALANRAQGDVPLPSLGRILPPHPAAEPTPQSVFSPMPGGTAPGDPALAGTGTLAEIPLAYSPPGNAGAPPAKSPQELELERELAGVVFAPQSGAAPGAQGGMSGQGGTGAQGGTSGQGGPSAQGGMNAQGGLSAAMPGGGMSGVMAGSAMSGAAMSGTMMPEGASGVTAGPAMPGAMMPGAATPGAPAVQGMSGGAGGGTAGAEAYAGTDVRTDARREPLSALLRPSVRPAVQAQLLPTQRLLLPKGAFIDCTLETAIDSTLPGMTTCVMATDAFGADGKVVLLERGTKLIGETRGQVQQGAARIFVLWTEARAPTGVVVPLDSPGTDELGRSGLSGEVDRHFWQRFGAAMLVSVVDGVVQAVTQSSRSGSTVVLNPSSSQEVLTEILKNTISVPPTVTKKNGDRIQVLVARDVDFRSVYELRAAAPR